MQARRATSVTGRVTKVQGPDLAAPGRRLTAAAVLCACSALAGCSGPKSYYPVDWWRQLEGGRIAEARPAPPRDDDPYPHLGSVPPRPPGTHAAAPPPTPPPLL